MKGVGREMAAMSGTVAGVDIGPPAHDQHNKSTINPQRLVSGTIDIGLIEADSVAPGASMVGQVSPLGSGSPVLPAPDADGLIGGTDPAPMQTSGETAATRLQGVERTGHPGAKKSGEDLKDIVKLQSKRRQRRASLEIQQTPEQMAAMKRWRKLDTSIQLGSALSSAVKTAGDERQHLKRLHRQGSMRALSTRTNRSCLEMRTTGHPCRDGVLHHVVLRGDGGILCCSPC